ncbi:MAG: hypothetical protein ACKOCF_03430 [Gammaproteobacteria bacterium]
MKIAKCGFAVFGLVGIVSIAGSGVAIAVSPMVVDLELLAASQNKNQVQVPNTAQGTRFSLQSLTGSGPYFAPRLHASWAAGERAEWRVLLAPLALSEDGRSDKAIRFQGASFAAGPIAARYQFNSWRATWRWRWIDREDLVVKVGFTAKIRDASIRLRQSALSAEKDNTGFVPLLHASVARPWGDKWMLEADIDALAGGPGYAVDAGMRLSREIAPGWSLGATARFLDGGADNDEVYAFARFTSVGLALRWQPQ